ncbi:hypothetical protein, partial [Acinetobacter baumannii]|uniref:hypothetical protein n=1 Tax=Acinetobacter baumannii TaxID=470 RepID=UPI001C06E4ED
NVMLGANSFSLSRCLPMCECFSFPASMINVGLVLIKQIIDWHNMSRQYVLAPEITKQLFR